MSGIERQFLVSTDSSGLLGTPEVWKKVWASAFDRSNFKGFEMIGWGGWFHLWTNFLISEAGKKGCNVVGIHGRMGTEITHNPLKNLRARIGSSLLLDTPYLVNNYGNKLNYILLHAPELDISNTRQLVVDSSHIINQLFVENHLSIDSLGKAIGTVKQLRSEGVNAGIMFDLFHYFNSHNQRHALDARWRELLHQVDRVLNGQEGIPTGLHIPVGTNKIDSFPEEVTDRIWLDLGILVNEHPETVLVIENRQRGLNQLFPTDKEISIQGERNARLLDRFSNCKFI